jgi:hypothetical protein
MTPGLIVALFLLFFGSLAGSLIGTLIVAYAENRRRRRPLESGTGGQTAATGSGGPTNER